MTEMIMDNVTIQGEQMANQQMLLKPTTIETVAVLGAGVMGAQIAAHFVNAGYQVLLFDLAGQAENKSLLSSDAIKGLLKIKPAPFVNQNWSKFITACNYEQHITELARCDMIIEAIAERADWKQDLYKKIAPHIAPHAVLCTNTSGLSINSLADALPKELHERFCGVHFFNPPRYLPLIELIATDKTSPEIMDVLETFFVSRLGKNVVRAKDTPNFIGNRIGIFALLSALHYAEVYDLRLDVVDALTGPSIGHPKSATLRTLDIVGLDTFEHVVNTMANGLPNDPWHEYFVTPDWLQALSDKGALGQKTGHGIYKREGKDWLVYDTKDDSYRPATGRPHKDILDILKIKDPVEKFERLRKSKLPEAGFLWSYHRDLWHYAAYHLESIADTARDLDEAMRWGFAWKQGPFEQWQSAGWSEMAIAIREDIQSEKALSTVALPEWVTSIGEKGAYTEQGAYSPSKQAFMPRRQLPVYQRQLFHAAAPFETFDEGETLYEDDNVRLWHQSDLIGILSFKTKMCTISRGVLDGIRNALPIAIEKCAALVIWQRHGDHFSAGADITEFLSAIETDNLPVIDQTLEDFQNMCMSIRYAPIPVVGALRGYVFGGGCELAIHCDLRVAHTETYMGLVEAGVGLLPGGGGCKEFVRRASVEAGKGDPMPGIQKAFENLAQAKASSSAQEAREMGFLTTRDTIIMHPNELLYVAKQVALTLSQANYAAPRPELIKIVGDGGWAQLEAQLVNMYEGQFISRHDYFIAHQIAKVLCGGIITPDSMVDEKWLLRLEREGFLELAGTQETKERIAHMLKTGKPLRN